MPGAKFDLSVMLPTLIGAILSTIAASSVLLCYAILPIKRHFRHALIINLAIADTIAHGVNAVSGIYAFASHAPLQPGRFCVAAGFLGQMAFQAVDFSILSIAMVSFLVITGKLRYVEPSLRLYAGFTLCIWVIPIITSGIGLRLDLYRPMTACWCWLTRDSPGMRFALAHGIRISNMFITIAIYTRLWIFLRRHHKNMSFLVPRYSPAGAIGGSDQLDDKPRKASVSSTSDHPDHQVEAVSGIRKTEVISVQSTKKPNSSLDTASPCSFSDPPPCSKANDSRRPDQRAATPARPVGPTPRRNDITKILLLNGYPVLYVLLWLPALINRGTELTGTTPRWLILLQAAPQFIGLGNALTYGYNENIKREIRQYWANHGGRMRPQPSTV